MIASDIDILYEGKGRVPSNPAQIDSLKAESMGMYHALFIMSKFLNKHHCTQEITIASDNKEIIKRMKHYNKNGYLNSYSSHAPHMDIQCEINYMINSHFSHTNIVHVHGHQDTKKNTTLTWLEKLNIRADKLAKLARANLPPLPTKYKYVHFPQSNIQLYINEVPIHKCLNPSIHQEATTDAFINHLKKNSSGDPIVPRYRLERKILYHETATSKA